MKLTEKQFLLISLLLDAAIRQIFAKIESASEEELDEMIASEQARKQTLMAELE